MPFPKIIKGGVPVSTEQYTKPVIICDSIQLVTGGLVVSDITLDGVRHEVKVYTEIKDLQDDLAKAINAVVNPEVQS